MSNLSTFFPAASSTNVLEHLIWQPDGIREEMAKYEIQHKFNSNKGEGVVSFPWST